MVGNKLAIFAAIVGVGMLAGVACADNVTMSRHNLSRLTIGNPVLFPPDAKQTTYITPMAGTFYNQFDEVCVYCHTPHGGNTAVAPLWNRVVNTSGNYTPYSSSTIDTTVGQPGGVSLACLSCHDGTIAMDSIVNAPGSGLSWSGAVAPNHFKMNSNECGSCHNGTLAHDGTIKYLGTDLRTTHPVSMIYPTITGVDPKFYAPTLNSSTNQYVFSNGVKLYNGKVECASCHNPHLGEGDYATNPGLRPFLRTVNDQSQLCTTCHIK